MSSLGLVFVTQVLTLVFLTYTGIVVLHFLLQTFYAHRAYRGSMACAEEAHEPFHPSVDVIVASYNENPQRLDRCLATLAKQTYPGKLRVFVVDDGSPGAALLPVYERYRALPGWTLVLSPSNVGKRRAQDLAFHAGVGEFVATIDSDTEIEPDGIEIMVAAFRDAKVGAVTADVGVANAGTNLLTRLIGLRYWVAFNQERAAQSFFRSVLCCSGPFSVYRRSALAPVWSRYTHQTFRGIACTYGDDRHLTNLVLSENHDTLFEPRTHARTNAPTDLGEYLHQQLRWNRSFYRELLWTLPFLSRRPWYMAFEIAVHVLLPALLMMAVSAALVLSVVVSPHYVVRYAIAITVMALLRTSYALYRLRDIRFLLFILYGFLHAIFLIPVRVRALSTLTDNRWGTRVKTTTLIERA
jgi:cellulose synthase/poly-beta-1,6-N-acetylglucosamine synthase-like glycosyltransferase